MTKKFKSRTRKIDPDSVYNDPDVSKFINYLTIDGKKAVAEKIFYSSLETIKEKHDLNPLEVFKTAISHVAPYVEARSRRVGGSTYQVPVPVDEKRGKVLSFRWIVKAFRSKKGKCSVQKLSEELFDAYENRGSAISKKEEVIRIAESNKAFSHYRW